MLKILSSWLCLTCLAFLPKKILMLKCFLLVSAPAIPTTLDASESDCKYNMVL